MPILLNEWLLIKWLGVNQAIFQERDCPLNVCMGNYQMFSECLSINALASPRV